MRRSLATVVAVVVLVGGLTVGASTASTPAAANGVTKDEIKIGITYPDLEAIRSVTGSSLRLAYALADEHELPQATAAPTLSDDELIDRFMREFDAEELPADEES